MAEETAKTRFCRRCGAPIYLGEADCHYCGGEHRHTPWGQFLLMMGALALGVAGLSHVG